MVLIQSKKNKYFSLSVLLFFLLSFSFFLIEKSTKQAPNEIFTTIKGETIELNQWIGNPVLITFWATDCASCVKEIPDFIDLYQQFHSSGLEIIAIAMYYDIPSHVVEMSKAKQIPYPVSLDLTAQHANAFGKIQLTPTTIIIDPTGKIVLQHTGLSDINNLRKIIQSYL